MNISLDSTSSEIHIAIDHSDSELKLLERRRNLRLFSVLFRSEPKCVLPQAYSPEVTSLYDVILNFGKPECTETNLHWPQYWSPHDLEWSSNKDRVARAVMVNANKLSLDQFERYTLRRDCAKELGEIDMFGEDWNSSTFERVKTLTREIRKSPIRHARSSKSHSRYWFQNWPKTLAPADKRTLLKNYKFCLVIENELTYMSEKLFDALVSGCIPVYVGPRVKDYAVPEELVVEVEPSVSGVAAGLAIAKRMDFEAFQEAVADWFRTEEIKCSHLGSNVIQRALGIVHSQYEGFQIASQA